MLLQHLLKDKIQDLEILDHSMVDNKDLLREHDDEDINDLILDQEGIIINLDQIVDTKVHILGHMCHKLLRVLLLQQQNNREKLKHQGPLLKKGLSRWVM